ncbi:E3 ubiquitin-protein ligase TRIM71-like isoform X2 [Lingula anatina]|uniref:E3 ubiquitin-protein ligase TRIM71-like isoform X2 n=1 Tax=Lingula anatina TaxID=7574 RepID=A0A1S3K6T3_LINAN|nr:E3 ubiquitin-protein ligase TRIM71-like isoform X2 [Lingula anatina]|eukprot:XP_013418212.1 E3 ubiquitin-protein ligase TRIM71-like isoform X2 [Lingula anatina]
MASGGMASNLAEKISRDFLSCPICFELYDDPRALPCQHIFCLGCLKTHTGKTKEGGQFNCPICRGETTLPENGADGFPPSTYITSLKDQVLAADEKPLNCDSCLRLGETVDGTHRCLDCKDWLCHHCKKYHSSSKPSATHQVVTIEEFQSGQYVEEIAKRETVFCRLHPEEPVKLFCEPCEEPICHLCTVIKQCHKEHLCESIPYAVEEKRKILLDDLKQLQSTTLQNCKCEIEALKDKEVYINTQQNKVKKDIVLFCNGLIAYIKQQQEKLHAEVDTTFAIEQDKLKAELEEVTLINCCITSTTSFTEKLLKFGSDCEILRFHKQLDDQTKLLNEKSRNQRRKHTKPPMFLFNPNPIIHTELTHATVGYFSALTMRAVLLEKFCTQSPSDVKMPYLTGISLDRDDNILLADCNNQKVKVLQKGSGKLQAEWSGDGVFELNCPWDIACNNNGDIAIANKGNDQVLVLDSKFKVKMALKVEGCTGVTWLNQNCLVCLGQIGIVTVTVSYNGQKMVKYTHDACGQLLFPDPRHIDVLPNTDVVVADWLKGACVLAENSKLKFTYKIGDFGQTWGVCVDRDGYILVANCGNSCVSILHPNGKLLSYLVPADLISEPTGIVAYNNGNIAVAEANGNVKIFKL